MYTPTHNIVDVIFCFEHEQTHRVLSSCESSDLNPI